MVNFIWKKNVFFVLKGGADQPEASRTSPDSAPNPPEPAVEDPATTENAEPVVDPEPVQPPADAAEGESPE